VRALPAEEFHRLALPYYPAELAAYDKAAISRLIQPRVVRLTDIPEMVAFFVRPVEHDAALYINEKSKATAESSRYVLSNALELFDDAGSAEGATWTHAALAPMLIEWGKQNGIKTGAVMWPVRIALSGLASTPGGATEIAEILGKEETMRRMQAALEKLA
jgi:glutamyl-tRNA synthetase